MKIGLHSLRKQLNRAEETLRSETESTITNEIAQHDYKLQLVIDGASNRMLLMGEADIQMYICKEFHMLSKESNTLTQ